MPAHYHAGWDSFSPAPGEKEKMSCHVCGEDMKVNRNMNDPTGYVESIAKRGHPHDSFFCRHAGEAWHNQVLSIKICAEEHPSKSVSDIMLKEADQIIQTREPTKDHSFLL